MGNGSQRGIRHHTSAVDANVAPALTSPPFVSCFVIVNLFDASTCNVVGLNCGASEIGRTVGPFLTEKLPVL